MVCAILVVAMAQSPRAEEICRPILPEQRRMAIRDPSCLPPSRLPPVAAPATVSQPRNDIQGSKLSLDEAIRIALANSEVIRVLGGSSGQTQYDPAITNTEIDRNRAAFDPTLSIENQFFQTQAAQAPFFDPNDPNAGPDRRRPDERLQYGPGPDQAHHYRRDGRTGRRHQSVPQCRHRLAAESRESRRRWT